MQTLLFVFCIAPPPAHARSQIYFNARKKVACLIAFPSGLMFNASLNFPTHITSMLWSQS